MTDLEPGYFNEPLSAVDPEVADAMQHELERTAIPNQEEPSASRPEPRTPVEEEARALVNEELRDAYGAAFKTGAFVILLAIPFSWTMRRKPSDVHGGAVAVEAAAATAG